MILSDCDGIHKNIYCKNLNVGDIIIIEKDQEFPADLIILSTSSKDG